MNWTGSYGGDPSVAAWSWQHRQIFLFFIVIYFWEFSPLRLSQIKTAAANLCTAVLAGTRLIWAGHCQLFFLCVLATSALFFWPFIEIARKFHKRVLHKNKFTPNFSSTAAAWLKRVAAVDTPHAKKSVAQRRRRVQWRHAQTADSRLLSNVSNYKVIFICKVWAGSRDSWRLVGISASSACKSDFC